LQNGDEYSLSSAQRINYLKEQINNCALDPNGKAWTEENIANYTRVLENTKTNRNLTKEQWEKAVKAFKGLEYGNPTSFEGFDKVEEAVVAYNSSWPQYLLSCHCVHPMHFPICQYRMCSRLLRPHCIFLLLF